MSVYIINGNDLTVEKFNEIIADKKNEIDLANESRNRVIKSRNVLDDMVRDGRVIYGVNTGMGGFVNYLIPRENIHTLQENLICSVATNVGEYFEDNVVLGSMLARVNSLARGNSGIKIENLEILMSMFNKNVIPCIPKKGSLGASGDLGPLAFIAMVATGKWYAKYQNKKMTGKEALEMAGITPMSLDYKEGLALINGTSTMAALSAINVFESMRVLDNYISISCLTLETLKCKLKPFDPKVHSKKPHVSQKDIADRIYCTLGSSKMIVNESEVEQYLSDNYNSEINPMDEQIEDAYSARCTPQILGPVLDTILFVKNTVENELNSSNDNPLIIPEEQEVFHNGNFHGQYVAMAMDFLSISLTTMSNLSDRRIDRFMDKNHSNGLPAYLCVSDPGLRFGFMGGQFMSTSITAENRSLCVPLSIQTLTSTGDFQDIVSMGLIAARRCNEILNNLRYILSFELLCACQAADIRGIELLSPKTKSIHEAVREHVPFMNNDETITDYIETLSKLIVESEL